jgi:tetratricopeptide (TPR) repeat protein
MQNRPMPRLPAVLLAAVAALASLPEAQTAPAALTAPVRLPPAEDAWIRIDTEQFVLYSDASEEDTAAIARQLEMFRVMLSRLGSGLETRSPLPIVVYVFRDPAAYRPYRLRPDIAGFFVKDRDGNSIAVGLDPSSDPWQTIFHEYVHFVLNNNFIDIPLWFDEGMAEAYSTFRIKDGTAQLGQPIPYHRAWLRQHGMMPFEQLFAIDTGSKDYEEGARQGTFYAESWALVHYLFWSGDVPQGRRSDAHQGKSDAVRGEAIGAAGFLGKLKRGGSVRDALRPMIGDDLKGMQEHLAVYVKTGRFAVSTFEVGDLPQADQPAAARPVPRSEVLYRLGNYLLHLDARTLDAAEAHLREAVRLDPKLGAAWADLGQVEHLRGHEEESGRMFERALSLAPEDQGVALLYAYSLVERTFPPGVVVRRPVGDVPPRLVQARDLFRRAMREAPRNVEAWAGLGSTYAFDAGDLEPGIEALEKAMGLAPGRVDIAIDLAALYARSGRRSQAEGLIDRIVSRSSDPEQRAAGEAVLLRADIAAAQKKIDEGDIEGGVAMLRRLRSGAPVPDRDDIDSMLQNLDQTSAHNQVVATVNRAVALINAKDYAGSIRILEAARAQAPDKDLQGQIDTLLQQARRAEAEDRHVELYNQAVRQFNAHDYKAAATTLRRLLADRPDERIGGMARDMMSQIKSVAPGV